jgi:mRNA interferase RelE/StbE
VTIEVKARPEVSDDLRNLGSNALRLEAFGFLIELETNPLFGLKLDVREGVGDLSDCRKIYFDKARHRIVYRVLPDERNPASVDVIVIGPREELDVYTEAIRRLGRLGDE